MGFKVHPVGPKDAAVERAGIALPPITEESDTEVVHHLRSTEDVKGHALHGHARERRRTETESDGEHGGGGPNPAVSPIGDGAERSQDALFRRRISQAFFVTNLAHIVCGIVSKLVCAHVGGEIHDNLEDYFHVMSTYHDITTTMLTVSSGIQICAGLIGLLWTICCVWFPCHYAKLFHSHENYLSLVIVLNIGASLVVAVAAARPLHPLLSNIMLTEAYHWKEEHGVEQLKNIKDGTYEVHTILDLEMKLGCCGLHDFRDWYFSPGHFITGSCCAKPNATCIRLLEKYNVDNLTGSIHLDFGDMVKEVVTKLWPDNCLDKLQDEVTHVRVRWAVVFGSIILGQVFLFAWSGFLCNYIKLHLQYNKDIEKMQHLQKVLIMWDSFRSTHFPEANAVTGDPVLGEKELGIPIRDSASQDEAELVYELQRLRRKRLLDNVCPECGEPNHEGRSCGAKDDKVTKRPKM